MNEIKQEVEDIDREIARTLQEITHLCSDIAVLNQRKNEKIITLQKK